MRTRHHDLVVIGTGSGNSVLTPELAHLDIAVVESGRFGGTCLNVGCIPTKMYVYPADLVVEARRATALGVRFADPEVSWDAIRDRVFGRIDPIAAEGESHRRTQERVTVYGGHARFVGERRLAVDLAGGSSVTIEGERVVIAAGGHAVGLDLDGLRGADPERGVHTSDTVMRMRSLPGRMAVIGGGFVAAEFAHVFDAFGVAVTHLHRGARLLKAEDEEVAQRYTEIVGRRYDLRLGSRIVSAQRRDDGVWALTVAGPSRTCMLEVDAVLLAVGRRSNAPALDVAAGGVAQHPDGRVVVDGLQRTSVPGVYALGDVSSDYELKHVANHEARVVAHN
ncbi:MAG TPA: FAD-dependent oxidoreductase, partial [Candidatus Lustribacter sp.]|nr:FAD-dependent oxidoreductase [Candidatus Lustribacter sp.]